MCCSVTSLCILFSGPVDLSNGLQMAVCAVISRQHVLFFSLYASAWIMHRSMAVRMYPKVSDVQKYDDPILRLVCGYSARIDRLIANDRQ